MNKDVIYMEPEDDITDILAKIKNAKTNIVALVPPKQASVLRSVVNFKLLSKVATEAKKSLVLVTTDSSLVKLAAFVHLPVARNLQSKPEIPTMADDPTNSDYDSVIDDIEADAIADAEEEALALEEDALETNAIEAVSNRIGQSGAQGDQEASQGKTSKSVKQAKQTAVKDQSGKPKLSVPDFKKYRKFIIAGAVALVFLIGFLVWALAIAPKADIALSVRTKARGFSETVTFTKDDKAADPEKGIFLLEEQKLSKTASVEFEATGEVDKGTKASGALTISRAGTASGNPAATKPLTIPKGSKFTIRDLIYITDEAITLAAGASGTIGLCPNPFDGTCFVAGAISATVKVVAEGPGEDYNITAASSDWVAPTSGVSISSTAMTGGTSKIVKIVSQNDINKAKAKLESIGESEGKSELMNDLPESLIIINSSFLFSAGDIVSTPKLGEELPSGNSAKLSSESTFLIYGVDRVKISEYIQAKVSEAIADESGQKVYSTGVGENKDDSKAFIEAFRESEGKFTGKLKSTAQIGPEVTNEMVIEKSLGRKIGEVQSQLKSINGVSSVNIETPFFWVTTVPNDINKVSVEITIEG